jgi:hypothetical protein
MYLSDFHGIGELWRETLGDSRVCVAVLDGPVDLSHPCFRGADLLHIGETRPGANVGPMTAHGTHVASIIFGQPEGPLHGIAPKCRGLLVPVFSEKRHKISQLSLSEAISKAVEHGAHVINVSSGQLTYFGESEDLLEHAVQAARKKNVLIVAAAGNDRDPSRYRYECLHVPAALPSVLTVGAMDDDGHPLDFSCCGPAYRPQGVLALGKDVPGAVPGPARIHRRSGTSLATPIVSGVAALLLSLQLKRGRAPDPHAVRTAILEGAEACDPTDIEDCGPYMAGRLHAVGAIKALSRERNMSQKSDSLVATSECTCETAGQAAEAPKEPIQLVATSDSRGESAPVRVAEASVPALAPPASARVAEASVPALAPPGPARVAKASVPSVPALGPSAPAGVVEASVPALARRASAPAVTPLAYDSTDGNGLVFFIGLVGYDFGTEARRDTFKQQMPPALFKFDEQGYIVDVVSEAALPRSLPDGREEKLDDFLAMGYKRVPPNPFDARQMVAYLRVRRDEARSLIWTLNLELTPVYSIEPVGPFADQVYSTLVDMLDGQSQAEGSKAYVERVSVPAVLSGQSVRLFSGQVVSQLLVDATRGMHAWRTSALIETALAAAAKKLDAMRKEYDDQAGRPDRPRRPPTDEEVRELLRQVLNKLYYEYRNLGITSPDRALNFAATNIFQITSALVAALLDWRTLERIDVGRSPYGRIDSDCWDVLLKFFDPENTRRAYTVLRFTLDVSDKLPVTMGPLVVYTSIT